jgi:undecaprenyl-diphosphatase
MEMLPWSLARATSARRLGAMDPREGERATDIVEEAVEGTAAALRVARRAGVLVYDELLLLAIRRLQGPWRTRVALALTRAGDARSWALAGTALLLTGRRPAVHAGLRLAVGCTAGALAAQVLKRTLNRARPTTAIEGFEALAENPDAFSFPSGHTAAAFGAAVALGGEAWCAGPLALLLATGIALSRVYLGAHYPLDVLVGGFLGAGAGAVARIAVP